MKVHRNTCVEGHLTLEADEGSAEDGRLLKKIADGKLTLQHIWGAQPVLGKMDMVRILEISFEPKVTDNKVSTDEPDEKGCS